MGCFCSRQTDQVGDFSVSSWTCCFRSCCCFHGTCVVYNKKHESTPSVYSTSIHQGGNISSIVHHHQILCAPSELNLCNESRIDIKVIDNGHMKGQNSDREKEDNERSKASWIAEPTSVLQEDKDSCAICLEGYDSENPSINTVCEHNFHLACILEWMERSDNCPMCDKVFVISQKFFLTSIGCEM